MLLALAGDTMLGRGVAERLRTEPPESLFAPEVVAFARRADLFVLNLECCISTRGDPWPDPRKPFFFRAPPNAVEVLSHLGVDCVTLANNHALDFGAEALGDTLELLDRSGIAHVGAGRNIEEARAPVTLETGAFRLRVIGLADHPEDFAAGPGQPGIALADLREGLPSWVAEVIEGADADAVLVTPHWGPNMAAEPIPQVRRAARDLEETGATLVAGHSAHVFHGVEGRVLFDLGDFIDDYAVDGVLRNDLGVLWLVTLGPAGPRRVEGMPLRLDFCSTRAAAGEDAAWIARRFRDACRAMGTAVHFDDGLLTVSWD